MAGHSILAPSSGARNVQCPASTLAEAQFPEDESSPEAVEGTAAHWVMSEGFTGELATVGMAAPNGVVITDEMIDGAKLVWNIVYGLTAQYGEANIRVFVEARVDIKRVHDECWGTPDVVVWAIDRTGVLHLYVIDFKFGHCIVEAFENQQTIDYAVGSFDSAGYQDAFNPCEVHLAIVQPRAFHKDGSVRWWNTNMVALRAYATRRSNAAHEALSGNARYRVGEECEYCRARHACPELQRHAGRAADYARGSQPLVLDDQALGVELMYLRRAKAMLEARLSGLEEQAVTVFRQGRRVPLFTIERSPGREKWTRPIDEILTVGRALGVDIAKAPEAVTPKQARDKGLDSTIVAAYSQRNPGEAKLVFDPTNSTTRKIFGGA